MNNYFFIHWICTPIDIEDVPQPFCGKPQIFVGHLGEVEICREVTRGGLKLAK